MSFLYGVLIALTAFTALVLLAAYCGHVSRFFGWSLYEGYDNGGAVYGWAAFLLCLTVPIAAEVVVFVPERRTVALWIAAAALAAVTFLTFPAPRFDPDRPTWLAFYDGLARLSILGVLGCAALCATSTGGPAPRWALGIASGSTLLVLSLFAVLLPPLRDRHRAARLRFQQEDQERKRRNEEPERERRSVSEAPRRAVEPVPRVAARPVEPTAYHPAQPPRAMNNASAQQAMAGVMCRECGERGYDVETYALGGNPLWYLGRCPSCGNRREFRYG